MIVQEHNNSKLKFISSVPDNYSKKNEYGIVIMMHGYGASMHDLVSIAQAVNDKDYIYIFPNAPIEMNVGFYQKGYAWFPIETADYIESSELLEETIEQIIKSYKYNKIYIGGFSQGGMMALHAGLFSNRDYSGTIILSSKIIDDKSTKIGINNPDNTKIFISHGRFDSIIDIEEGRRIKQTLQKQGFDLFYKEYDIGHEISADVIEDLSNWLEKN
ncbi:MAG: hypothetical protein VX592_02425 [Chloroflexota bacterium]|jgi:predicted esterase|nr:hypothetical protein [Chloroflexota bacterium]MEC9107916.1 hypothetical protein [Chloroflexota bacterium]MED5254952.1 hypothetical protein [Chloroflexota bacterium]MQF84220.1 hypothetical protein [SAR202 cluster bacterium]MQG42850.1 hypothetical protein [SAR202 cluster bacterium]|tara:strand:+ start:1711 stop:2358 length:648 start_codon:yes stop_codon:yes gene_type:complete